MRKHKIALAVGMAALVIYSQVIAQPETVPVENVEKQNVEAIKAIIEEKVPQPTKEETAQAKIDARKKELAAERAKAKKKADKKKKIAKARAQRKVIQIQAPQTYNAEKWRSIVSKYPWPVEQAMLVISKESKGNPRAVSATDDHGLFQIHGGYAMYGEKIYDPEFNVSLAYNSYYKTRGWTPWYAVQGILW